MSVERYKGLEIRYFYDEGDLEVRFCGPRDDEAMDVSCGPKVVPKLAGRLRAASRHLADARRHIEACKEASVWIDREPYAPMFDGSPIWCGEGLLFTHEYLHGEPVFARHENQPDDALRLISFKDCHTFCLRFYPNGRLNWKNQIFVACSKEQFRRLGPSLMKVADFVEERLVAKRRRAPAPKGSAALGKKG